jgi:DNA replication and repair protein RecF
MIIERLTLRHFRNYKELTVTFAPEGVYFSGPNGSGKTNLLEAIYYLANQASFRTTRREELQAWNTSSSAIEALVTRRETQQQSDLALHLTPDGRRLFFNGKETRDVRKFTAQIAAVAFHPGTPNVIKGAPASRRYLVDRGIFSLHPEFALVSQRFQRALKQRNALIRTPARYSDSSVTVWTERFIASAVQLMRYRQAHVEQLNRTLKVLVQRLGDDLGFVSMHYQPAVFAKSDDDFLTVWENEDLLRERCLAEAKRLQRAEEAMGQTLFGPQRDDFLIRYRGRESRGYASQGEQRLAAFLLVAALAVEIQHQHGYRPIMLLDDIISELDERHRQVIFDFLHEHAFQVFITDVRERPPYRTLSQLASLHVRQVGGWAELWSDTARYDEPYATPVDGGAQKREVI